MDSQVFHLTSANDFQQILEQPNLIVLKVYATWCGPCKSYAPMFEECAAAHQDYGVYFIESNNDQNFVKVESLPTTLFIKDKQIVDKIVGIDMDLLREKIKMYYG
jgi:thioredoxin 1